jgi:YbbR domain-containing protein
MMNIPSSKNIKEQVLSNAAYKIVALIAALILWLTVLGRKEITQVKEIPILFHTQIQHTAIFDSQTTLRVEVMGHRRAIKVFKELDAPYVVSLRDRNPGVYNLPVSLSGIQLPIGLKVLSVKPTSLKVELQSKE